MTKLSMGRIRWINLALISGLLLGLAVLAAELPQALRSLSSAQTDNTQWTILQVETEFANLSAALAQGDEEAVSLRADILLSRIGLVQRGKGKALFSGQPEATEILARLAEYNNALIAILDAQTGLGAPEIAEIQVMTEDMRPSVRRLAVLGLTAGAQQADDRREGFAVRLRWIGVTAMALIACLLFALFVVERLLSNLRRREIEVRASSDRQAATVAASLDGIIISNEAGEIIDFNASAEQIFGWRSEDILGLKMRDTIIPPKHRDAHDAGLARYQRTRTPHVIGAGRVELSALRKTGEEFPIELNITTAEQDNAEIYIAYIRDISRRKINEQRLIDAKNQAETMDRAKSRLLTVMSHEMRTPLNGILGVLDLLKTTDLADKQENYVNIASASGEILLEHVNEALDVTRLETGELVLNPQEFDLEDLVSNLIGVLTPLAQEKGLKLRAEIDPNMARSFVSDAGRIRQILTNLLGNAIKFTLEGDITVAVSGIHAQQMTTAKFSVIDKGPGIAPDMIDAIFEDFVELRTPMGRQRRNDGLGLSISKRLAGRLNGTLKADSTIGEGSTFTLTLPMERAEASRAEEGESKAPLAIGAAAKRILIVEDNPINRSVLRDMLLQLNHEVFEAEDGLQALEACKQRLFDLIIMDISMPEMDGIEATQHLRSHDGTNRKTHILGLTAHGREEFRERAIAAGMDGFCTKPLRFDVLKQALHQTPNAPPVSVKPSEVDAAVVNDLVQALGAQKTREFADQFFSELEQELDILGGLTLDSDLESNKEDIDARLHKLRGAAVLLGQSQLAEQIDAAASAAEDRDAGAYTAALTEISEGAPTCQATLKAIC